MNNSTYVNLTSEAKWTNSFKNANYHKLCVIDNLTGNITIKEIELVM